MKSCVVALACIVSTCICSDVARAERRFAVFIGNNAGALVEPPLRFAEDDAERMAQTLTAVGDFRADDVVLIKGGDANAIRRALIGINDRIRELSDDAVLLVFYSGHADTDALHVAGDTLPVDELEGLTRGSPARFRVLILDACRSGALTQVKGGAPAPLFAVPAFSSSQSGPNEAPNEAEGYVVLTAAAAGEDAAESDVLGASFFSHALSSGLLGAADGDGDAIVSLAEAYEYAFAATVRASSQSLSGTQHPTFRYDMRGKGDLAMSRLEDARARRGTLVLADGLPFLVFDDRGRVVAEVTAEGARRLSLPAGEYFVRARAERALLEGTIRVTSNADAFAGPERLERVEYSRLVRKGGADGSLGLALGGAVHSGIADPASPCLGGEAHAVLDLPWLTLVPRLGACESRWTNERLAANERVFSAALDVHRYVDLSVVSVGAGAVAGLAIVSQNFSTKGSAPGRIALAPTLGLTVDGSVELPLSLFASVTFEARTLLLQQRGQGDDPATWITPLTLGGELALGYRFF